MTMQRLIGAVGLSVVIGMTPLCAQHNQVPGGVRVITSDLLENLTPPSFSPFEFLLSYFPSEFLGTTKDLKWYIRSNRFKALRREFGDLRAVDAIYFQSLRLTHGNTAMALFTATLATMDHRIVGMKIPVLKLFFPLGNESEEEFSRRIDRLPSRFYEDSQRETARDRDKLQHFFGSAFIAFAFESRGAAERIGAFIEWGEDAFIVEGAYDDRDLRANRQGAQFGLALLRITSGSNAAVQIVPSDFLKVHVAHRPEHTSRDAGIRGSEPSLCGAW